MHLTVRVRRRLVRLERDGQVLFRYVRPDGSTAGTDERANPNGSLRAIAGVMNAQGNVAGLMPHPERASEQILGSDDGIGMPAGDLRRIFDPFFTTKRGAGGTGLGMHIVYNLVTQMLGGTIEVFSTEGRGTRVVVAFPAVVQKAAT